MANFAWWSTSAAGAARFGSALRRPRAVQERILLGYLRANSDTCFGRRHGFARIRSVAEYQARVPLCDYDDYQPWVERIMAGEQGVLTAAPVRRLVPSSGSTRARKLIPYTAELMGEFNAGVAPWIVDLFRRDPALMGGPAYWSVSPAAQRPEPRSAVPIGFDDDSAYLGNWAKPLVDAGLAVPSAVSRIQDMEAFRYATLLFLLRARGLRLISVWHPSFLTLLLEAMPRHWGELLNEIGRGGVCAGVRLRADGRRARELAALGPADYRRIWPRLRLISCWTDAHAATFLPELRAALPGVRIQGKGLIATECFVTLPLGDGGAERRPVAVRSHFFEFLADDGRPRLAHELERGGRYSVIVTTGGGLYRYRLHDRVVVDSLVEQTPSLRFVGKEDHVCDLFGEKVSEPFAASALRRLFDGSGLSPRFAMLAPEAVEGAVSYTLFIEAGEPLPGLESLARGLEFELQQNPHYGYCRALGQLAPARVLVTRGGAYEAAAREFFRLGRCIGNVKPSALGPVGAWSAVFETDPCRTRQRG